MLFEEFIKKVIKLFEDSGIDYVIVGGIAAIYYGEPRTTQDIDIIIRCSLNKLDDLCRNIEKEFILIGGCKELMEAIRNRYHVTIFDREYLFRIDLQGVYNRLNELAFEGRRRVKIFGIDAWIQGPEDLIIAKLKYYIGSRDLKDVIAIIKNSRNLIDWSRLWRLAKEFEVEDKIKEILSLLE